MLQVNNLSKSYSDRTLFDGVSFTILPGEKVALVGRNGHGKTTLMRILLGQEAADEGNISMPNGFRIGSLAQVLRFSKATALEEAALGLPDPEAEEELYKVERMLEGLGFEPAQMKAAPTSLSGGFQLRIELAKALLGDADILLLDEPTNYLDIVALRWLAGELKGWDKSILMISHDREFLNAVCTATVLIHRGKAVKLQGTVEHGLAHLRQQEEIHEKTRINQQKSRKKTEDFIRRFGAKASKASVVQSRVKELAKQEVLEELENEDTLAFSFREQPFFGKRLVEGDDLSFGYSTSAPLFSKLGMHLKPGERVAVVGPNGRGKSSLLRLLAEELQPWEGRLSFHPSVERGFFAQTNVHTLDLGKTIEQEVMKVAPLLERSRVRAICGQMMFSGRAAEKKIEVLSGGERSRVLLAQLIAKPLNLLLLDEPTSHLDVESVDALMDAMRRFQGAIVFVSHSELFVRELATRLIVFQRSGVLPFDGTYQEFLETVGWEEEQDENGAPRPTKGNKGGGKSNRKKVDGKALSKIEAKIAKLEEQLKNLDVEMAQASQQGNYKNVEALLGSKREFEMNLENLVKEWETLVE